MRKLTQAKRDLLDKAAGAIVDGERLKHPEQDADFWDKFRDVFLAMVIEDWESLLPGNEGQSS